MPPTIFFSHKPRATSIMRSRYHPLHACGVSILTIVDTIFSKTQNINEPFGSTLRRVTNLAKIFTPLIVAIQYQWLAILSFIDDHILEAEKLTEKLFPPSTYLFDKVDELVLMIMSLPQKFDGAINILFPMMIHHVPLLEWTLSCIISWLNGLVSILNHWEEKNSSIKEKTISVYKSSDDLMEDSSNGINSKGSVESFPSMLEASEGENVKGVKDMEDSCPKKGSYKEVLLDRGKEENPHEKQIGGEGSLSYKEVLLKIGKEDKYQDIKDSVNEENESAMKLLQVERSESMKDDPLLELFESAWLMKPRY
ncbi:hypothetical protein Lalb_Chr07g0187361 [Lupinus albus]|uniref:Uncharacterized protein n=1 Tax=Lupinus albus TaxID=3870 RepID=A0A6A4Q9P7_LUPAL|nr:hypothetical protein Lalb_Chr07g0187361 [Lupinus albus]